MAVDYFHRLIVTGTNSRIAEFGRRVSRTYEREVLGERWTEHVPFSFTALQQIAPMFEADEIPWDPYDLSVWPRKRHTARLSEVRYQFQTRNMDLAPLVKKLSRRLAKLTFRLMTLCLDDGDIETWEARGGRMRHRKLSDARREPHWEAARRKFKLKGDDVYDDDDAMRFAEERMCADVLNTWDPTGRLGRLRWSNGRVFHKLRDEQAIFMAEFGEAMKDAGRARSKRKASVERR